MSARERRCLAVLVAAVGLLVAGVQPALAQGTLEICKSAANGASGVTFGFAIQGVSSPVSVRGGRCSGPMSVPHGSLSITETGAGSGSWQVASVVVRPSQRSISQSGNTAVVTVPQGSTAANETRVTFVNEPAGGLNGDLKVCKLTETPAYYGRQFSFSVNGGSAVSTEANPVLADPSTWTCRLLGSFRQGSVVRVQELPQAGSEIAFIDSDPAGCLRDFDTAQGYADALIGPGACVVLFDNEPVAPTGTGFIEVCKDAGHLNDDRDVLGVPFDFTIDEPDRSSQEITVLGGQCSAPIPVAAGAVRVTEHASPGYSLVDAYAIPEDRLLASNLVNRTVDVEVPASDNPADETQVHFVNARERAQLKICKALGPGSSALSGREYVFDVLDLDGFQRDPLNPRVVASSAGTQCVIVGVFPIGNRISVKESNPAPYSTVSCSPGDGLITLQPGINTVTCTNQALGKLEICKLPITYLDDDAQPTFTFRIDGGPGPRLRAGTCSPPRLVVPGNHTVQELISTSDPYELDPEAPGRGITVTPSEAEVSKNLMLRTVTVAVPWAGPDGDEVRVDFSNRVKRGWLKVCKTVPVSSLDALGNKEFEFDIRVENIASENDLPLRPGECSLPFGPIPVLDPDGGPYGGGFGIDVSEATSPYYFIDSLTITGGSFTDGDPCETTPCDNFVYITIAPGTNVVTYRNRSSATP